MVSNARRLRALEGESDKPKRLPANATLDNAGMRDLRSKMVAPATRREAVAHLDTTLGMNEERAWLASRRIARACGAIRPRVIMVAYSCGPAS